MWEKVKKLLSNIGALLVVGLTALVGLLVLFLKFKNDEVASLKTKIDLIDTQKKADLLEVEIKQKLQNTSLLQKEIDELNSGLVLLEGKRKQLVDQEKNKTTQEIEEFWNKK